MLNVQVNGENVGYVESEQVFENAREDVQSRINTAKRMLQAPALRWRTQAGMSTRPTRFHRQSDDDRERDRQRHPAHGQ